MKTIPFISSIHLNLFLIFYAFLHLFVCVDLDMVNYLYVLYFFNSLLLSNFYFNNMSIILFLYFLILYNIIYLIYVELIYSFFLNNKFLFYYLIYYKLKNIYNSFLCIKKSLYIFFCIIKKVLNKNKLK